MNTKRIVICSDSINAEAIEEASEILKNGGTVAIPTETVYGLAANAYDKNALEKIFIAKGRPGDNPLIVHIAEIDMIFDLACDIPPVCFELADMFWPGPLTIILNRRDSLPDKVSAGLSTVAVRMPSHPVAVEIIKSAGLPLAAPSANLSGSPSPVTAEHVIADLDGRIDAVVVSNRSVIGVESTVVSLACKPPRLLRPGGVTIEQLKKVLPDIVVDNAVFSEPKNDESVASPGMKYKHYSPKAQVIMVVGDCEKFTAYVNCHANKGVCALAFFEDKGLEINTFYYGSQADFSSQASSLFHLLRCVDSEGFSICYAHAPQKEGMGLAVYNRLIRSAGFEVIEL